ncbi:hypothetical protein CcCBS67573_g03806 [Chytriomyces confervae]|uniref:Uncharacterized protein n=1 Tax=Chytriomyces confervae TaxID=246404 RepID=A0A507FEY9_9FUNG|nr:hypothetical protein CcCBS67573_g03806 [Chytriomyces confervae]
MGGCASGETKEDAMKSAHSKLIDRSIKMDEQEMSRAAKTTTKILLLGSGESGKSTILKQFKLIYGQGFSDDDVKYYRAAILGNLVLCSKALVQAMDKLKIPYQFNPAAVEARIKDQAAVVASFDSNVFLDDQIAIIAMEEYNSSSQPQILPAAALMKDAVVFSADTLTQHEVNAIKELWADTGVQYCYRRSNEFQLLDCCGYFMAEINRVTAPNFIPTKQDILQARITTTGVSENMFTIGPGVFYRVFDMGGQRSERRKWAVHFSDCNAIIFLIAISAFDQLCIEDNETNRMAESLTLFSNICNHPMFKHTSMIVFLNKIDLFKAKLKKTLLSKHFPNFKGPNTFDATSEYFAHQITELNKYQESKIVYIYYTWATDTTQIETVFCTVNVILLQLSAQPLARNRFVAC